MGLTPVLPCHSFSGHTIYFSMVKWFSLYREPKNRIWLNDSSMAVVKHRNLRTVPQLQLFQNTAQIIPDCPLAEKQFGCNFPVIESQANPLQMTEVPGSYAGFYLESQIESYLRQIHLYRIAGFSEKEFISLADEVRSPSVTVLGQPDQSKASLGVFSSSSHMVPFAY